VMLFAVVSFIALREFLSLAPIRPEDRLIVALAYLAIPISYAAIVFDRYGIVTGDFMSPVMVTASSTLGLVHASCLFLAFHPPVWYRDWVESRSAAEAA